MSDVFLSYRNTPERRVLVKRLAALLRAHHLIVWWDYGLEAGESFRTQITAELSQAKVVVPLWCSESIKSKWVQMEAELGKDRLVPARLQSVTPPSEFADIQAADLIGWDGSIDDPRTTAFIRKVCVRAQRPAEAPVDMIETLRELRRLPPLADVVFAAEADQKNSTALLADLRTTWTTYQSSDDHDVVERFFEHVSKTAPGTGLEFEVRQHLDQARAKASSKTSATVESRKLSDADVPNTRTSQPTKGRSTSRAGTVISVASGKGGVGKSWLATSLAVQFARKKLRTLLIDGNLGHANVDVLLKLEPEKDLAAVIAGWAELEDVVCSYGGGGQQPYTFDVLPGRSGSGALAGLPAEETSRLAASVTALALHYDIVLVDLGPGSEDNVMRMSRASDTCLIVVTDEPTSMTDAYCFLKILNGYSPDTSPWIVVNMADSRQAGRRTYEALARAGQTFLKFRPPLAGIVLRDDAVRAAIRSQSTIFDLAGETQAGSDVRQVSEVLFQELKLKRK